MRFRVSVRATALVIATAALASCSNSSPANPTPARIHANLSITSITVVGARGSGGAYEYRTVLHLRESAGAAATITSVDLSFMNGANAVTTTRFDQTIPGTGNVVPANGVAETRELVTADTNTSHPYADSVVAKVTCTDSTAVESAVSGSAAVPPLNEPLPPSTYTLRGIITEHGTDRGIEGARVEALNGTNAGKATLTDSAGAYTLSGLLAEAFRMRASATGFDSGEQNVTVPDISRADMALRRTAPAACVYLVSPSGSVDVSFPAGQLALTITRTSGNCAWQASTNVSWISLGGSSGSGDATLTIGYQYNALFVGRTGAIVVEWTGGSGHLTVNQAPESPAFCRAVAVTVGGQSTLAVPAAGGAYTALITPEPGTPPVCGTWTATASAGITLGALTGPTPGSVSFTVQPNTGTTPRALSVNVSISGGPSAALSISQSGS